MYCWLKAIPLADKDAISLNELIDRDMVSLSLPITQQFFLSVFSQLKVTAENQAPDKIL